MRNNVLSFWADYRHVDELQKMWLAGHTGSDIAAELGITRCAVLGKIHRLDLAKRPIDNNRRYVHRTPEQLETTRLLREERRRERRRNHRVTVMRPVNFEALRCVEVVPLHKDLVDLGPNDCRYPYGDGPFTFCGHPQMEGRSYCGSHTALSFRRLER